MVGRTPVRGLAAALGGYLAARVVGLLILVVYGHVRHVSALGRLGSAWDAGWYVRIVQTGYSVSNGLIGHNGIPYSPRAFFPLYPGLAEPLYRLLPVSAGTALALVSSVAGIVAAGAVYACAAHCHGPRAGVVAAVLWGVLPLAAIENMAYSESLFTAFAGWCLYAVLTRRWIWAGSLCVLAGLTRPTAMALTAAVGVAALVELHGRWRARTAAGTGTGTGTGTVAAATGAVGWWRPLAAGLMAPLGWVGYMLWTGREVGSLGGYFHIQDAWGSSFDGGISSVRRFIDLFAKGHPQSAKPAPPPTTTTHLVQQQHAVTVGAGVNVLMIVVMVLTLLVLLALFVITLRRRQPLVLLVYCTALVVMDLGNASPVPPLARFLLPAFPLLFPLAERLARLRPDRPAVLGALLGGLAVLSGLYGIVVVFVGGAPA